MSKKPRETINFHGHTAAEEKVKKIFASGKIPHAILISGPKGVGKSTLAFRIANHILSGAFEAGKIDFVIDETAPCFRKISIKSHPDLFIVDIDDDDKKEEISIDKVREVNQFLRATSAETGWRIVIVDSVDEMNQNSSNAILKILEEPGKKTLLIMITHSSGAILATIKSRCLEIKLKSQNIETITKILEENFGRLNAANAAFAIGLSGGSAGIASQLYKNEAMEIYAEIIDFLMGKSEALEFLDKIAKKEDAEKFHLTCYLTLQLISRVAKAKINRANIQLYEKEAQFLGFTRRLEALQIAEVFSKIQKVINETTHLNMDKKSAFLSINNIMRAAA